MQENEKLCNSVAGNAFVFRKDHERARVLSSGWISGKGRSIPAGSRPVPGEFEELLEIVVKEAPIGM